MIFRGKVKDGKPSVNDKAYFYKWLSQFEGKDIMISVEKFDKLKTTAYQYRYYYSAIVEPLRSLLKERGYDFTKDQVDVFLKSHLLRDVKIDPVNGTELVILGRKSKLSKEEMVDYIEKCIRFCAEEFSFEVKSNEDYIK